MWREPTGKGGNPAVYAWKLENGRS